MLKHNLRLIERVTHEYTPAPQYSLLEFTVVDRFPISVALLIDGKCIAALISRSTYLLSLKTIFLTLFFKDSSYDEKGTKDEYR